MAPTPRLRRLRVEHFKAFESFAIDFGPNAFLVGPNNAGKSTLIAAVRAAARMLSIGQRRIPRTHLEHRRNGVWAHELNTEAIGLVTENLRHEFRTGESILRLSTSTGLELTAVWPAVDGDEDSSNGFFYIRGGEGMVPVRATKEVKRLSPNIGIVPGLYPINQSERVLDTDYLQQWMDGRRSSQHTRNHLYRLTSQDDAEGFQSFAHDWLPEIERLEVSSRPGEGIGSIELDVFIRERGSRIPKELFWAGDGIQVFVQLLFHLWRHRDADVIILDEPDLYLHADLQRRLVRLLASLDAQTITATHSSEMLAEAAADSVLWVDKSRQRAIRRPDPSSLQDLSAQIGSAFNLRLAAALRARTVVFVEGDDVSILRHMANTLGANRLAEERDCTVIGMGGFTRWPSAEAFQWLLSRFLQDAVEVYVVLDRDYRTDAEVDEVQRALREAGTHPHVWQRKELENYLLDPRTIAKLSKANETLTTALLEESALALQHHEEAQFSSAALSRKGRLSAATIIETQAAEASSRSTEWRLRRYSGKDILSTLNRLLQQRDFKAVSPQAIARALPEEAIPSELANLIDEIEASLSG